MEMQAMPMQLGTISTSARNRVWFVSELLVYRPFDFAEFESADRKADSCSTRKECIPWLNEISTISWRSRGEWRCSYAILNLNTTSRWTWASPFTSLALYSRGNSPRYRLPRRLGWVHIQSERYKKKNFCFCREWNPDSSVVQRIA